MLDRMYNEYRNSIRSDTVQNGIFMLDGWKNSNANTKNVVAIVRTTNGHNVFLELFNFSEARKTGEALTEVANDCINIAARDFNTNIYAVSTDNASNMMRMGRNLPVWYVTCNSHSGNLLFESLTYREFDRQVSQVVKDFRSPNLEAKLKNLGGRW